MTDSTDTSSFSLEDPEPEVITLSDDESFETPPSSGQIPSFVTPKPAAISKRLRELKGNCNSPALTVPASPLMKRLGFGTGVGVYLLERSPKTSGEIRSPWAIKKINKIKVATNNSTYRDRLEYEASVLKQLNHPNIVGYRGFSNPPNAQPVLAMESAPSSLSDLIESQVELQITKIPFPSKSIEKVALDIANALDYLHEEKKMIHGDLKSGNVLIFGDFEVAKLCDFGVAQELRPDGTVDGISYVGTQVWNPMEVILYQNGTPKWPITSKADIYPFGLTIFEMIALQHPHIPEEDQSDDDETNSCYSDSDPSFDESAFEELLAKRVGTRPPLPDYHFDSSYNKILEIFYCTTEEDPSRRPTAEDIIALLSLAIN